MIKKVPSLLNNRNHQNDDSRQREFEPAILRVDSELPWLVNSRVSVHRIKLSAGELGNLQVMLYDAGDRFSCTLELPERDSSDAFLLRSAIQVCRSYVSCLPIPDSSVVLDFILSRDLTQLEIDIIFNWARINSPRSISVFADTKLALRNAKKHIWNCRSNENKLAVGFGLDAKELNGEQIELLAEDYCTFAWGPAKWAKHSKVADDELELISRYFFEGRILEVGCGSGRLTKAILERLPVNSKLTGTDISPSVIQTTLKNIPQTCQIDLVVDDIRSSRLTSDTFDQIFFLENGLGALATVSDQTCALNEMTRLLKPGGLLILGVRELAQSPVGQIMFSVQTPMVMGFYQTFGKEILEIVPTNLSIVEVVDGDPRPAGGHAKFYVFKKEY